ncbi:hypothetical protein L53_02355 [Hyphomonas sp. L-53-1-40]|uniref:site-specific DNA-methyltransferase n=1 Tax=Hyphomonas sp. L-53-1-40 TaxID=1207058 RepID=UPI000458D83E|nr:site-specific DNA-methyltransferase [Hyphomonas sp. L-53-1-40]KCZ66182.1 hypothetical protein L53_02355 [Hyphomonas sp. L-53-1-40]
MPTLDWIGKQAVVNHHREVPYRLVHCDSELSAGDPDAGNLLVQGDNLEALRALLPYYAGKVKCIYIDPPYNTGNEGWVYNDNVNSPEIKAWLGNVVGKEAEDLSRHDKWLCMMYPRMRLLRDFLREDGVIFISMDDNASGPLRFLMDEIFGASNFLACAIWQKVFSPKNSARFFSDDHEYVYVYARNISRCELNLLDRSAEQDSRYSNVDNDPRGPWTSGDLSARNYYSEGTYPITTPSGRVIEGPPTGMYWRISKDRFAELDRDGRLWWGERGDNVPRLKRFLSEVKQGVVPQTLWFHKDVGNTQEGKKQLLEAVKFDDSQSVFITPKPTRLIERVLKIGAGPEDIIMDSFAGSGTTGHAILEQNKRDGGNRKFILVEMDDTIARNVTAERLRRVIKGYDKGDDPAKPVEGLGGGFRFCRMGTPLFDEFGDVATEVTFPDLAAHIFFSETGVPIPQKAKGDFLGVFQDRAVYLLFDAAHAETPREAAGNVLTPDRLDALPAPPEPFEGQRVIYAEGCTVSKDRLKSAGAVFKQIPYQIYGV